jgi:hypothetical protein
MKSSNAEKRSLISQSLLNILDARKNRKAIIFLLCDGVLLHHNGSSMNLSFYFCYDHPKK